MTLNLDDLNKTTEKLLTLQLHKSGLPVSQELIGDMIGDMFGLNPIVDKLRTGNIQTYSGGKSLNGMMEHLSEIGDWNGLPYPFSKYDFSGMGKLRGGLKDLVKRHYDMGLTKDQIIPIVRAVRKQKIKEGKEAHRLYVKDKNEKSERQRQERLAARRYKCK